jgi:hypothetical protein
VKKKIYFLGIKNLNKYFDKKYEVIEITTKSLLNLRAERDVILLVINLNKLNYSFEERELISRIPTLLIADTLDESNLYLGYTLGVEEIIDERLNPFFIKKKIDRFFEREELLEKVKLMEREVNRWGRKLI